MPVGASLYGPHVLLFLFAPKRLWTWVFGRTTDQRQACPFPSRDFSNPGAPGTEGKAICGTLLGILTTSNIFPLAQDSVGDAGKKGEDRGKTWSSGRTVSQHNWKAGEVCSFFRFSMLPTFLPQSLRPFQLPKAVLKIGCRAHAQGCVTHWQLFKELISARDFCIGTGTNTSKTKINMGFQDLSVS